MTDKVQKIKEFLIGMAGATCCDTKTKKNIETIILPFVDSLQCEQVDYCKLQTSLNNALSKETKESWDKFLQEEPVSIWHDVEENPDENRDFAFVDYDGVMWSRYKIEDLCHDWQSYVNMTGMTKWAYTSDLIKL